MVNDFIFAKPEEEGLSSARILKFIERLKERKTNLHSFMMVRNGKILTEAYYKPFDKDFMHRLYSSSKTYVSIAIGMLIGEGKIRLEDRISDLMPDLVQIKQHVVRVLRFKHLRLPPRFFVCRERQGLKRIAQKRHPCLE